jgi:hypothetical protein
MFHRKAFSISPPRGSSTVDELCLGKRSKAAGPDRALGGGVGGFRQWAIEIERATDVPARLIEAELPVVP